MIRLYLLEASFFQDKTHENYENRIDLERRKKITACKATGDKAREVAAGLLFQYAIKQELGVEGFLELSFEYRKNGKPYLIKINGKKLKRTFFFSLSHSKNLVGLAVSDKEIGMDLQKREMLGIKHEKIAKRFFRKEECEYDFFEVWTAKESYLKYTGAGMALEMKQFLVEPDKEKILAKEDSLEIEYALWEKREMLQGSEKELYQIAVCSFEKEVIFCEKIPIDKIWTEKVNFV